MAKWRGEERLWWCVVWKEEGWVESVVEQESLGGADQCGVESE